jgi:hypothetical protein
VEKKLLFEDSKIFDWHKNKKSLSGVDVLSSTLKPELLNIFLI